MKNKLTTYEADAAFLFRSESTGILSTVSKKVKGYPFGSLVTYVSGKSRVVFFHASDLAEHTKNFMHNSKASLTVTKVKAKPDQQNSQRLTLMGDINRLAHSDLSECTERFFKFFPESQQYQFMHDFSFYRLDVKEARWIGGFGEIAWLDRKNWGTLELDWSSAETAMINHMNDDHSNVIYSSLFAQHGVKDRNAKMISMSIDGYHTESQGKLHFISFTEPCYSAKQIRGMLISQANAYRQYESN